MTTEQARDLKRHLAQYAKAVKRPGLSPSRRIEGEFDSTEETRGYRAVHVLLQKGLAAHIDAVEAVLRVVTTLQRDRRICYPLCLYTFGHEDGTLQHTEKAIEVLLNPNVRRIAQIACDLSGAEPSIPDPEIPALWAPVRGGRTLSLAREDLFVILCGDHTAHLGADAREQARRVGPHCIQVFLDTDTEEIVLGMA